MFNQASNETDDEAFARQLQQQMLAEQEEHDAALARQLHAEEQQKMQVNVHKYYYFVFYRARYTRFSTLHIC